MKRVTAVWHFIAGDARSTPWAVCIAVLAVLAIQRLTPLPPAQTALIYVAILAAGLIAAVNERPA